MKYLGICSYQSLPQGNWKERSIDDGFHIQYSLPNKVALCIYHDANTEEFALFEMDDDFKMDPKYIESFGSGIYQFIKEILLPHQATNISRLQNLINQYSDEQIVPAFPIDDMASVLKTYDIRLYQSVNRNSYEISIGNRIPIAVGSRKVASKIYSLIVDEIKRVVGNVHNPKHSND